MSALLVQATCPRGHSTLTRTGIYFCPCGQTALCTPADSARVDHSLAMDNIRRFRELDIPPLAIRANIRMCLARAAEARNRLAEHLASAS